MESAQTPPVDRERPKSKGRINPAQLAMMVTSVLLTLGGKVAPRPASKVAMRLLFTPLRTQPSAGAKRILDQASTEVDIVDGNRLVHYIWGDGERRVLLLHGWSTNAGQVTSLALALVAAGFRVFAVDLPGHGRSEGKRASVIHFEKVIEAMSHRYGPFSALVAHSISAAAATYALSRGVECERVVFFNPVSSYESVWRRSAEKLRVSPELMGFTTRHAEKWLDISFDNIEPTALAPGLPSSLLVIHDKYDRETPIADSEALVQAWPDAELVTVEKLGHTRVLHNDDVVRRVVDFVATSDGSSSA